MNDETKSGTEMVTLKASDINNIVFIDRCHIASTYVRENLLLSAFALNEKDFIAYSKLQQAITLINEASACAGKIKFYIDGESPH